MPRLPDSWREVRDELPPRPEEPLMELEEETWRLLVVMVAVAGGRQTRREGSRGERPKACVAAGARPPPL